MNKNYTKQKRTSNDVRFYLFVIQIASCLAMTYKSLAMTVFYNLRFTSTCSKASTISPTLMSL